MPRLLIYQIAYSEAQKVEFNRILNLWSKKPHRFEWGPMLELCGEGGEIHLLSDSDYFGVLSWKFGQKTGLDRYELFSRINPQLADGPVDVFTACKPIQHNGYSSFMQWSEEGHKGTIYLLERCLWNIGAKYYHEPKHIVYANQFITTKAVYLDFINNWAKPSLELLEGELWPIVNKDAGYQAGLPKRELKRLTGLDFYNYLPFVMERLFSQYLANKPELKVKSLL